MLANSEFVAKAAAPPPQYSASYPGSTITLGSGDNDGAWFVNQSDSIYTDRTRMTNTINHGGALLSTFSGLDHIVMGVRGSSLDEGLQILAPGVPIVGTWYYGEYVGRTVPTPALYKMISGRGITFWAAGTNSRCADSSRPCAIFENYTTNLSGPGLIESGKYPLNLSSSPFNVTLTADDYDMTVIVTQNGVNKGTFSCRAMTGNDYRCGAQANDAGYADAFAAFVNGPAMAGRTIGVTNINVTHSFYGIGNQ
ncbi:MAG: hypothetical protein WAQ98_15685 [Blastocatellia bacterium]